MKGTFSTGRIEESLGKLGFDNDKEKSYSFNTLLKIYTLVGDEKKLNKADKIFAEFTKNYSHAYMSFNIVEGPSELNAQSLQKLLNENSNQKTPGRLKYIHSVFTPIAASSGFNYEFGFGKTLNQKAEVRYGTKLNMIIYTYSESISSRFEWYSNHSLEDEDEAIEVDTSFFKYYGRQLIMQIGKGSHNSTFLVLKVVKNEVE